MHRCKVGENKDERAGIDVPTTLVAYVRVMCLFLIGFNQLQSKPPLDVDWIYRDPVASVDSIAVGLRSSCQCGQGLNYYAYFCLYTGVYSI